MPRPGLFDAAGVSYHGGGKSRRVGSTHIVTTGGGAGPATEDCMARTTPRPQRPVFLNPFRIQFPAPALLSILHRISGALLFLAIPAAVYLLERSLSGPQGFAAVRALLLSPGARVVGIVAAWAFAHHVLAGLRFLLIDVGVGVMRGVARASAWAVNAAAVGVLLAYVAGLAGWL